MTATAELALKVLMDAADAVGGFDKIENAAAGMASAVEKASANADAAVDRISRVADSSDNLASKSSQATGSLGALASGFELVGAEKYAAGLQSAALATDFLSGVGDALNLVTTAGSLANARAAVTTTAKATAEKAAAVATKAYTVAQWAMNAALTANPLGLVIVGLVAIAAAVYVAYRRSATFREIVAAAMDVAQEAFQRVSDKAIALGGWLLDLKERGGRAVTGLKDKAGDAVDGMEEKFGWLKDQVTNYFQGMLAPIQALIDKVQAVIDKVKSIDLPGVGRVADPFARGGATLAASGGVTNYFHVEVNGAIDPDSVARQFEDLLNRFARRTRLGL